MTRPRYVFALSLALVAVCYASTFSQQRADRPAREMTEGASHFLGALSPEEREEASLAFASEERFDWHYIPRERKGLPYKRMTPGQRKVAHSFLATGLSHVGMKKALDIMYLDQILYELQKRDIRDPDLYYFSVFGRPSPTGTWGWRVEGHHLSLNFTLRGGRVVSSSPSFFGANPAVVREGPNAGMRALAEEELLGRALLSSFSSRDRVVIEKTAPSDIVTEASRRAEIGKPAGVSFSEMTEAQQGALLELVRMYANRMRPELAELELERIGQAGLEAIHFAWAGGSEPREPHYYRIHGPTFLIEYDNTQNGANHIHTVWRDLTGDFGEVDPLTDHYATSPHHRHLHVDE